MMPKPYIVSWYQELGNFNREPGCFLVINDNGIIKHLQYNPQIFRPEINKEVETKLVVIGFRIREVLIHA